MLTRIGRRGSEATLKVVGGWTKLTWKSYTERKSTVFTRLVVSFRQRFCGFKKNDPITSQSLTFDFTSKNKKAWTKENTTYHSNSVCRIWTESLSWTLILLLWTKINQDCTATTILERRKRTPLGSLL